MYDITTISICRVKHVYGFEVVAQAVSDARQNAKLNCIDNATFIEGDLNKIDLNFASNLPTPDIVITGSFMFFMDNLFHLRLAVFCKLANLFRMALYACPL